jgi:hypothetical protein
MASGLTLPQDFVAFQTGTRKAPGSTGLGSGSEISVQQPVTDTLSSEPFRFERFLRDQQDCVLWYLYLRPSEEAFVVHDYDYDYE